ncbi:MAG: transglycosylase domain-containing protein [Flavobacteriaceae bacterium]
MGENNNFSKYIKWFWMLFAGAIAFVALLFLLASAGAFGEMPTFEELENPSSNLASEIISSDGKTIGKLYLNENRTPIKYEDLPQNLIEALVATEDERFYEHSGIDARGTLRAAVYLGKKGGASTITQQLAKQLFHEEGSKNIVERMLQKVKEWIIAVRLERQYTKQEILTMYLNQVDFVNNAVGIRSASRVYFSKEPKDLNKEEAAVIVGMLKNPSWFNPRRRLEITTARRNTVLGQMEKNDFITEQEKDSLQNLPLVLKYSPESHNEGIATYFREYLREYMRNWVKENPKEDGSTYNIYRDGLKIYTTIDSRMQTYAEEAVSAHLANLQEEFFLHFEGKKNAPFVEISKEQTDRIMLQAMKNSDRWRQMKEQGKSEEQIKKSFEIPTDMTVFSWKGERDTVMTPLDSIRYYKHFLRTGMISVEPQTGHIKAWVGGINHKYFKYDHAKQGARQVGSTFKPFVYVTAMEQLHKSPCDSIVDAPFTIPKGTWGASDDWTPKNSTGKFIGTTTLSDALAKSINTVSAKLINMVGPRAVVDMTKKLGVKSDIPEQVAISLGAVDISVHDMVAAYSTFANQGVYIKPNAIIRIEDKNGKVLFENVPQPKDVLSKDVSYAAVKLLEGVTRSGSGGRLKSTGGGGPAYKRMTGYPYAFKNPIAGKTGTTQNQSDGWFMGMVPNLVTGVWVGNEDRAAHFRTLLYGQGASMALPVWGIYMKKCYEDPTLNVSTDEFSRPENLAPWAECRTVVNDSLELDINIDEFGF